MMTIRVASANCEWMNNWFSGDSGAARWKSQDTEDAGRYVPREAARRVASMIRAIDPDILAVEEAPSRAAELQLFIDDYLSDGGQARYQFILGDSGGAQKLALLYKPTLRAARIAMPVPPAPPPGASLPRPPAETLAGPWLVDVNGTLQPIAYEFTRAPLVCEVTVGDEALRIIALHTKSNFVNEGESLWKNRRQEYVAAALTNRRRISAEAMRVRRYLDDLVGRDLACKAIVLGDLNDGQGMDYFEEQYLTHNVTDILLGSGFEPEFMFLHAQHDVPPADRYSAVFDDFVEEVKDKHVLLDHILFSPGLDVEAGLRRVPGSGRVHHQEWQDAVQGDGTKRDQRPSDHRPVSVQLELP